MHFLVAYRNIDAADAITAIPSKEALEPSDRKAEIPKARLGNAGDLPHRVQLHDR